MDGPRHSEGPQGNKKEPGIDPDLKEFIDNAIVPILVKEYLVVEQIFAKVLDRLKADRKGKP